MERHKDRLIVRRDPGAALHRLHIAGHNPCGGGEGAMASIWSETGRLPLAGLTVIDFGQIFQGPYATFLLAKGGADVIKVEPPGGEPLRRRALPEKHATEPEQARGDAKPETGARPRIAVRDGAARRCALREFLAGHDGWPRRRVERAAGDQPA